MFLANVPVLLASAGIALTAAKPATPAAASTRFDWPGSVLLTVALVLLVLGGQRRVGSAVVLAAAGAVVLIAFTIWERRARDPVIAFRLFTTTAFTAGTLLIGLQNLVMYALLFELPLILGRLFDLSASRTGQLLIFLMVAMVLTSLVAGRLTDRLGPRPLAVIGSLVCLAAVLLLNLGNLDTPNEVRVPLVALGIGLGLSSPAAQTASLSAVSRDDSGMAAGVSSTMRYLGGVTGIAILGHALDLGGTRPQVLHEHHAVLVLFSVVLVLALVCAMLLPGRNAPRSPVGPPARLRS